MSIIDMAQAAEAAHQTAVAAAEHATETAAQTGVLASLGINSTLFVFQLINFVVVAVILWFLVLKPLTEKMAARQEKIDKSLMDAAEVESNLRKSEQKYQEKIDDAKAEAAKIMEKTRAEAKELGKDMNKRSRQEIELLIHQAKKNIQAEKEEMISEVKSKAGELVIAALEKILEEKIDDKKDKEMILRSLKGVKTK